MPLFFDLSSLIPTVERNPFAPIVVEDPIPEEFPASIEDISAEPIIDIGLPIPAQYDFDSMRAMVQDPFRLFVYWQLKDNPYDRLQHIFPTSKPSDFQTVLKLIDETNDMTVLFEAAYAREYWFSVFPDHRYRVELGLRSPRYGYIKLLSSPAVQMPRGGPSNQQAKEPDYQIAADDYLQVLRESHLIPERAFTLDDLFSTQGDVPAEARNAVWDALPPSFRRITHAIADVQAGRDYDHWWERLEQEKLADVVRDFLGVITQMGDGELGYLLLLRYLPEVLRRSIEAEQDTREWVIDKPITLYLAEKLGQVASEMNAPMFSDRQPFSNNISEISTIPHNQPRAQSWLPSLSL